MPSWVEACNGLVVGSPVYYASANATLVAFLTRLFYSTGFSKSMKVGAAIVAARRLFFRKTVFLLRQRDAPHEEDHVPGQGAHGLHPLDTSPTVPGVPPRRWQAARRSSVRWLKARALPLKRFPPI